LTFLHVMCLSLTILLVDGGFQTGGFGAQRKGG